MNNKTCGLIQVIVDAKQGIRRNHQTSTLVNAVTQCLVGGEGKDYFKYLLFGSFFWREGGEGKIPPRSIFAPPPIQGVGDLKGCEFINIK